MNPDYFSLLNFLKNHSIGELVDVEREVVNSTGELYAPSAWSVENFEMPLNYKEEMSSISLVSSVVAGFSIAYQVKSGWAHISRFGVSPNNQGSGVGRGLVSHQLKLLESLGVVLLTVETSIINVKALQFYNHVGFNELSEEYLDKYIKNRSRIENKYMGETAIQKVLFQVVGKGLESISLDKIQ